jgi:hypothetical protein
MLQKGANLIFLKMEAVKGKKVLLVGVFASLFFLPSQADAKMFGQECETVVTGGGESCVITQTICKQRFFWINVGTSVEYGAPDCTAFIE